MSVEIYIAIQKRKHIDKWVRRHWSALWSAIWEAETNRRRAIQQARQAKIQEERERVVSQLSNAGLGLQK
ncbi:MAG TPA: hypothetical protein VEA59_06365 [Patescibacteria group bacterium]|nr:hypothetical protein [Patescibacteria group bacterium]